MSHTKGKWIASEGWNADMEITTQARIDASLASICTIDVDFDGEFGEEQLENMSRILACVNACEGISTENLEENKPLIYVVRRMNELLKHCDGLLEVAPEPNMAADLIQDLTAQMAEVRKAIDNVAKFQTGKHTVSLLLDEWVAICNAAKDIASAGGALSHVEKDAERYRVFVAALVAGINHDPLTPVQQAMLDAFALEEGTATVDEVTAVIDAAMATAKVTP